MRGGGGGGGHCQEREKERERDREARSGDLVDEAEGLALNVRVSDGVLGNDLQEVGPRLDTVILGVNLHCILEHQSRAGETVGGVGPS